jgi:hypothetical protein
LAIDIDDHSQRLTLDIVTSLAFNKDFKQVEVGGCTAVECS